MGGIKHGLRYTKEYTAWDHMKRRCNNPKHPAYKDYGGRGISVCDRWMKSFENFISDVGFATSSEHSLDRYPNNNGNYEPSNCRWATPEEQNRNKRNTTIFHYNGAYLTALELSRMFNISKDTVRRRLNKGVGLNNLSHRKRNKQ